MTNEESDFVSPDGDRRDGPWWNDLIDVRVIMFLVSVVVVVMTATVLILSDATDPPEGESPTAALKVGEPDPENDFENAPAEVRDSEAPRQFQAITQIDQDEQAVFELPGSSASFDGCQHDQTGISNWQSGGSAVWQLKVDDRRTGFFRCYVTYQAKSESRFWIQLGLRKRIKLTLYPHDAEFTEQLMVRLDRADQQLFSLTADRIESSSEVSIKAIRLEPR